MTSQEIKQKWMNQNLTPNAIGTYLMTQASHHANRVSSHTLNHIINLCYQLYRANVNNHPNGDAMEAFKDGDLRKFMHHADDFTLEGIKLLEIFWVNVASSFYKK